MSSSRAERPSLVPWPRSLTVRLTLLYTLTTLVILLFAVSGLYWSLLKSLQRDDNEFLKDKIQVLRQILAAPAQNTDALHEEVDWEGGTGKHKHYYVRILEPGGTVFRITPGMTALRVPGRVFPSPGPSQGFPGPAKRWCQDAARCYWLQSAWAGPSATPYRLELLLDASSDDTLLADYRHNLLLVLFTGTLFAAGVGMAATRRGLRPLKNVIQTAHATSAGQLSQRIGPAGWPLELADLGTAFDTMLERLQSSFDRISRFSTDLAHELRTPINNLMGELEVALSHPRSPEEYRQTLESGLEECNRLASMIDRLLFLARADGPLPPLDKKLLDARAESEAVCEYFEALAEEKSITLAIKGNASLWAESVLFRRALGNLVSNALQYTPAGGHVAVTLGSDEAGLTVVQVADTGIGLAETERAGAFRRFYRSEAARHLYPQGTGLGLAIVQSIMTLHGGQVTLEGAAGAGTLATLRFPAPE